MLSSVACLGAWSWKGRLGRAWILDTVYPARRPAQLGMGKVKTKAQLCPRRKPKPGFPCGRNCQCPAHLIPIKGTLCVVSFSVVGCHPGHSCSMSTFFLSPVHLFPLIESKEGHFPSEVHLDFMLRRCSQYGLNCNCLISQDIKVALTCCLNIL